MPKNTPLIPGLLPIETDAVVDTSPEPTPTSSPGFTFSARSLKAMEGIHPDLRKVADLAIQLTPIDFVVTEGVRTEYRQAQMVAEGKSQTYNSRHLYGKAIDIVDYPGFSWSMDKMKLIADAFKAAATQLNIPIHWGGDWVNFQDSSHIELDKGVYPDS